MEILGLMDSTSSLLPPPDPTLLEDIRRRFIAEMRAHQTAGMTKADFQKSVWDWANKTGLICNGIPWLTADRAAEAFDDPMAFARDHDTHPRGLLTTLEMWGGEFSIRDLQVVLMSWHKERNGAA